MSTSDSVVLVRADRDEPVKLTAVGTAKGAVLVTGGDAALAIGFPGGAVFSFEAVLFAQLRDAFRVGDERCLKELWAKAEPFGGAGVKG